MVDDEKSGISRDLEMGLAQMEQIKATIESLRSQAASLQSIMMDYSNSLDVIKELEGKESNEVLMPIGGSAFLKVRVLNKESCLIDRGAGVFVETGLSEAEGILNERMQSLRNGMTNINKNMEDLMSRYDEIAANAQDLYNKQMQTGNGPEKTF
jgi:prefoldin alpha subunit